MRTGQRYLALVAALTACGRFGFDAVDECPTGSCATAMPDAQDLFDAPRGMPGVDTDGDTVFDDTDNCIMVGNPAQHDEDSDGYGDVCDNCPSLANTSQTNVLETTAGAAADTVGDACDPRPAQPGESLLFFDTFEGSALTADWSVVTGTWSVAGDAVEQASLISDQRIHGPGAVTAADYIVETAFTFTGFDTGNVNAGLLYRMTNNNGWLCAVFRDDAVSPPISRVMLWTLQNGAANFERSSAIISEPMVGTRYRILTGAHGSEQYCAIDSFQTGPSAPFTSNKGDTGTPGMRTNRTTGTYHYIVVYALGGPI